MPSFHHRIDKRWDRFCMNRRDNFLSGYLRRKKSNGGCQGHVRPSTIDESFVIFLRHSEEENNETIDIN